MDMGMEYPRYSLKEACHVLCALTESATHAVILFHARPDGDAVGSAFALRMILEQMGLKVRCLCADEVPSRLRFLTDGVQTCVSESALPAEFLCCETVVISVDTASVAQMGALADTWQGRVQMMIDHHELGTPYAPALIDPTAAATGELIYALGNELMRMGAIDAIPAAANIAIYAAISSDTGSFRYTNVTERTFSCAAALRASGVDTAAISHALFECKSFTQLKAEHLGFEALQLWEDGRVAVIPFSYALKTENGIRDEDMETLVDVARVIEGVEIVLSVRQPAEEGRYRVSTRSSGAFCVAPLCARFGGGGHAKAAGCTVMAESMDEVLARLRAALREELVLQNCQKKQ
ncbi:MAG: DHH family phosphoesterase [Clostridia bacterium]|nr:DHH family phosphoesterase [Clostridia bacterium]